MDIEFARCAFCFSGGHFFEVQYVVDQAQKVTAGEFHVGQVSQLFFSFRLRLNQQVCEAKNGIEGGANLVAHHR